MRNTNQNSGSKSAFKPIIATSLALALGVSVASAAGLPAITASGTVNADIDAPTVISGENKGGLIITPDSAATITLEKNINISNISASGSGNAYGVYVAGKGASTLTANSFSTITLATAPTGGTAQYIFANTGTGGVTFKNVAIVVGSLGSTIKDFGIYNAKDNSVYDFGTSGTTFTGANGIVGGTSTEINAKSFTGVILKDSGTATLGGVLNVKAGDGASVVAQSRASFANKDGGAGGSATGIELGAALTVANGDLTLNVTGGNGGSGATGGVNGAGGSATGILATGAATVSGGDITINLTAGNNGGATTPNSNATLIAIDNKHATGTLAFANGVNVGVGSAADSAIALKSNLLGVRYNFGAGDTSTFGTTFAIEGATPTTDGAGNDVTGAKILQNAVFNGKVSFSATGGNAKTAGNGGKATGLEVAANTLSFDTGSDLTITAVGGTKAGSGSEVGGEAKGILLTSGAFDASKATSIKLTVGDGNTSSATGVDIQAGKFTSAGTLTFGDTTPNGVIAATTATGINLKAGAEFDGKSIVFNKVDAATATGITSAGTFTSGNITLGTIGGTTSATALNISGNFTAGNITLTSLGTAATTSATVLDLNGATLSMGTLEITSSKVGKSDTADVYLIKNSNTSTIEKGTITLDANLQGTENAIISNAGTLNFGTEEGSNASLILGGDAITGADVYGFSNKITGTTSINFGIANFYTTGTDTNAEASTTTQSVIGANLEAVTKLNGVVSFNTTAKDTASSSPNTKTATGMKVIATALTNSATSTTQILGDLTLNVNAIGKAGAIGLDITTATDKNILAFGKTKTIDLNVDTAVDSTGTATGIIIRGGSLSLMQDNPTTDAPSPNFTDVGLTVIGDLNVGSANAQNAVALSLTSGGALNGTIDLDTGAIGNDKNTAKAVAIEVNGGTIGASDINVGNILHSKADGKKYILDVLDTTSRTFSNTSITAVSDDTTVTTEYGILHKIANNGYNFGAGTGAGDVAGVVFNISGKGGTASDTVAKGHGEDAHGAIIYGETFFEGNVTFKVAGGNAAAPAAGTDSIVASTNGGSAYGIDLRSGSLSLKGNDSVASPTLTITANGGTATNGTNSTGTAGSATGISLASGSKFDASNGTLTLKVGNTTASSAIALQLTGVANVTENTPATTFAGSFTADKTTNVIGNDSATTATLIKNTSGTSIIKSGVIQLVDGGLKAKADTGVKNIIDNTGTLNFGTGTASENASLAIVNADGDFDAYTYGFANNVADTAINFGTANFITTGNSQKGGNGEDAVGMIINKANTTLQGNITFTVTSGGSDTDASGNAYGIYAVSSGSENLTIKQGSSVTLEVDSGVGETNGEATGFTVTSNALAFTTDGALNLQVGTNNASKAVGFHFANGGYLQKDIIVLDSSTDKIGNDDAINATALLIDSTSEKPGFSLHVGEGVLVAGGADAKRYILDLTNTQRANAITFTTNDSASQTIVAGSVNNANGLFGIYSADAGVSYNFGSTATGAGAIFSVTSTSGNATGAIIARDATFEGTAALKVTANAEDATAVGIRLDGTSNFNANPSFKYGSESLITANNGTAIALQATGTHTITGGVEISTPDTTLVGQTKYIFQNTGTITTFKNGSLIVGDFGATGVDSAVKLGSIGLFNSFDGANYAFGESTIFDVKGDDDKIATGAYFHTTGQTINFSGNVTFKATGGDKKLVVGNNGMGLFSDTQTTLKLAQDSTITFIVDSGTGANSLGTRGEATGIRVVNGALTIQTPDADGKPQDSGTRGFVFNVGTSNAGTVTAIDLDYDANNSLAGSITGDLVVGADSVIGNTSYATDVAVVRLSDYRSTLSDPTNGQNIIVGMTRGNLKAQVEVDKQGNITSQSIPYILSVASFDSGTNVGRTQEINFVHDNTDPKNIISKTITAGDASGVTDFYGLYSNIADVAYNFGYKQLSPSDKTIDNAIAGTVFSVTNTAGDAVGAILADNTTFEGKAQFNVTAKDGSTAVGIRLDNSSSFGGDFDYASSTIDAGATGTAIALQTTGTDHTISGNITIASDILTGKTEYIFQNTATGTTTFTGSLKVGTGSSGVYGLYSNLANAVYAFGNKTVFKVQGATFDEGNDTNLGNAAAAQGLILATSSSTTKFGGNVEFNVTGGGHKNTATGVLTFKNATGLAVSNAQTLASTNKKTDSIKFVVDTFAQPAELEAQGSIANNIATGMTISTGGTLNLKNATSNLVFEVGQTNAQKVTGIELNGGSIEGTISVADGSIFGNSDYTTDLAVIRVKSGSSITSQDIKIGNVILQARGTDKADAKVYKYVFKNESGKSISFGENVIQAGTTVDNALGKFSLYNALADVSYDFGAGSDFSVKGSGTNAASGMILADNTRFVGTATFEVKGSDQGGSAYGVQVSGSKELTMTLAANTSLTFDIQAGTENGEVAGIYAKQGALKISKEDETTSKISFKVGALTQDKAYGVRLDNGVFDGGANFESVKAKSAYGIYNAQESIIKSGEISFDPDAFKDVPTWSVIENTGNLTIARDASVRAGGVKTGSAYETSGSNAAIYNNIEDLNTQTPTYNLGNLNIEVAEADTSKNSKAVAYGIYSEEVVHTFNVATGKSLTISAVDAKSAKAFGGSVNLNLESGSNVYLNTDGGTIQTLTAGDGAYIYLSGKDKASRVGYASSLNFRDLTIDLIKTPDVSNAKAVTSSKGANFVVLADATRGNGTSYNADGTLNTSGKGSAYTRDGKLSTTGGSDRIIIDYSVENMPSVSRVDNQLNVALSSLNTTREGKYVVLAQVAKGYTNITDEAGKNQRLQDLVTFNGLKNEGDSVAVQTQVGFDTANITITRHDLATDEQTGEFADVGAVYVSNLIANGVTIDSDMVDASVSAISTNYDLVSANLNSLSKRMGELRNTDNAQGVWGRVFAGQQTSNFGAEQKTTYLTFQAGYDYNVSLDSGVNYTGLALSYIHSTSTQSNASFLIDAMGTRVDGNANSTSDGVEVAVYNSYISDMGLYSDSIVKFGYFASDLNIPTQDTYTSKNFSFALSEEIGYRVKLGAQDEWFIDPQVELAYAYVNGSDFTQVLGSSSMKTAQDAISLLRSRLGAAWGYKFDHLGKEKGVKASLYLGTYYAYDMISGGQVNLETNNGTTENYDLKSNGRFVLNVGTDVAVQDTTKFYVDFEKSFGSTMQTDYQVSVGVRYSFGAKTPSAKKEEKKESAPLKVGE